MEPPARAGGLVGGLSRCQLDPSQLQVSEPSVPLSLPPNSTSWPVPASYAIEAPARAAGLTVGDICDQPGPRLDVAAPAEPVNGKLVRPTDRKIAEPLAATPRSTPPRTPPICPVSLHRRRCIASS